MDINESNLMRGGGALHQTFIFFPAKTTTFLVISIFIFLIMRRCSSEELLTILLF